MLSLLRCHGQYWGKSLAAVHRLSALLGSCLALAIAILPAVATSLAGGHPRTIIREEAKVLVDGHEEVWRLQWETEPKALCGLEDVEISLMCPCQGFAYAEKGRLSLSPNTG